MSKEPRRLQPPLERWASWAEFCLVEFSFHLFLLNSSRVSAGFGETVSQTRCVSLPTATWVSLWLRALSLTITLTLSVCIKH